MPSPAMPASHYPSAPPAAAAILPRHEALAFQTRDGLVESVHYGSLIATAPGGRTLLSAGEPLASFYPRSSLKPLQSVAMVRAAGGLGLLVKDGVEGFADGAQVLCHGGAGVCR